MAYSKEEYEKNKDKHRYYMKRYLDNKKPIKCTHCDYKSKRSTDVKRHTTLKHP